MNMKAQPSSSTETEGAAQQRDLLSSTAGDSNPSKPKANLLPHEAELLRLVELTKKLAKCGVASEEREGVLEKYLLAAKSFNIQKLITSIEDELAMIRKATSADLDGKREAVLQSAEKAGFVVRRFQDYDRIGPVRVIHKGRTTDVLFGKLRLDTFNEPNGVRVAEKIAAQIKNLIAPSLDAALFYKGFRQAYEHARVESNSRDGWLPVDVIYQEYLLGRMRTGLAKKSQQASKSAEVYPLVMFLIDFARFLRDRVYPMEREYIRSRTTPMGQIKDAYLIPDLAASLGEEKPYLDLRIEKES